jgi:Fic family protein
MYIPNFIYTNKTIDNMASIELKRGIILNLAIKPEINSFLKRNALIKSSHASTTIEGNTLTIAEVNKILNRPEVTENKEEQEVLNYLNVLKGIERYQENGKITEELLLEMNSEITKNTSNGIPHKKHYRNVNVNYANFKKDRIGYTPPSPEHIPRLMEELLKWINNNSTEISPITVAGTAHYELVKIQPFTEGNGRTARALTELILYLRLFDPEKYFPLEQYYEADKKAYLNALNLSFGDPNGLTKWMEYFTDGINASLSKVRDEISKLINVPAESNSQPTIKKGNIREKQIEIQIRIITFLHEYGKITLEETQKLLGTTKLESVNQLQKLEELSVIKEKKREGSRYYILKIRDDQRKKQWKTLFKKGS